MPQIRYTRRARRDLIALWSYIADHNRAAADRVYLRLEARIKVLEEFPEIGPLRPDIAPDARVLVERPYLILYRIISDLVQIVRILHGARRISPAMLD